MPVTIANRTDERVLLRFNSGTTHHLAPGEVLKGVEHVQVKGNARIRSLEERRIIVVEEAEAKAKAKAKAAGKPRAAGPAKAAAGGAPPAEAKGARRRKGAKKPRPAGRAATPQPPRPGGGPTPAGPPRGA